MDADYPRKWVIFACRPTYYTEKEGLNYTPTPEALNFGHAVAQWMIDKLPKIPSESTRQDYQKAIYPHILPFFEQTTFAEINEDLVEEFFSTRYLNNDPLNGLVARKRMLNILIPLRKIWLHTVNKYRWDLPNPFTTANEHIKQITERLSIPLDRNSINDPQLLETMRQRIAAKEQRNIRKVILFSDFLKVLEQVDDFYRNVIELHVLTGISASEMAGLNVDARSNGLLQIQWSLTADRHLKDALKSKSRTRGIPLTKAINRVLDDAMARKPAEAKLIFQTKTGLPLYERPIREAWYRACDKAGVQRVCPYSLRHSFVAYCEMMAIEKPRIIGLMGHADKSMVDTVYGKYVNFLERDVEAIKAYYGEDFWGTQKDEGRS